MPTTVAVDSHPLLPDWVPVLRRGPGEFQIGLDDHGLIVSGASEQLPEVLRLLSGTRSEDLIRHAATDLGVTNDELTALLSSLTARGLLQHQPSDGQPLAGLRLRILGAGRLGRELIEALLSAGGPSLELIDPNPVDPAVYPDSTAATQAEALRRQLRERTEQVVVVDHWSDVVDQRVPLTLVALDSGEPDRVLTADLLRHHQPHLFVRPLQGGAVVGPWVDPGRTPCLGCLDHHRTDTDAAWPQLLMQLTKLTIPTPEFAARWAATTVVTDLLATDRDTAFVGETVEVVAGAGPIRRQWTQHPRCGCAWV